jgi:hypothetical protein
MKDGKGDKYRDTDEIEVNIGNSRNFTLRGAGTTYDPESNSEHTNTYRAKMREEKKQEKLKIIKEQPDLKEEEVDRLLDAALVGDPKLLMMKQINRVRNNSRPFLISLEKYKFEGLIKKGRGGAEADVMTKDG